MPYIKTERRKDILPAVLTLASDIDTPGELNYAITSLINEYLLSIGDENSYEDFNEVLGVLEASKLEYYRRLVATYEDIKIYENGDVYG